MFDDRWDPGGGSRYERNEERGKKIQIGIDIEMERG